jgi:hypothetical protein
MEKGVCKMLCDSCRNEIPRGAMHCPFCGAINSDMMADADGLTDDLTGTVSSFDRTLEQSRVPENAELTPSKLLPNPYEYNPYGVTTLSPHRRRVKRGLIVTTVTLVLIIVVGLTLFALYKARILPTLAHTQPTVTPVVTPSPTITPRPTPSPTPTPTPTIADQSNPYYSSMGNLTLDDPMTTGSSKGDWQNFSKNDAGETCTYENDGYHVIEPNANTYLPCHAYNNNASYSNFTFEVQMIILKGGCGGISLRDGSAGHAYYFGVCQDGNVSFQRYDGLDSVQTIYQSNTSALHTGLNQSNTIAVVANGSHFDLYINQQHIASGPDDKYSSGAFGVSANSNSEVVYSHARLWM